jgi:predicted nucleic acid-binding protein
VNSTPASSTPATSTQPSSTQPSSRQGEFLDSNILVYAFTSDRRAEKAQGLLAQGCTISVQGLNEFANVARRKLGMNWTEVREALAAIRTLCGAILPIEIDTHGDALRIAERYGCAIVDALVIATALRAHCGVLWSEDMQDGLVVDRRLRIANPFQ